MINEDFLTRIDAAIKAVTTSTNMAGALLNTAQQAQYIAMLQNRTRILPAVSQKMMSARVEDIDRIGFDGVVLKPEAAEDSDGLAKSDWAVPSVGKETLSAVGMDAIVGIHDNVIRENLEGSNLENVLVPLLGDAAGFQTEKALVQGISGGANPDAVLNLFDGWLQQAQLVVQEAANDDVSDSFTSDAVLTTYTLYHGKEGVPILPGTWTLSIAGPTQHAHDVDDGDGVTGTIVQDAASGIAGTINYLTGIVTLTGLTVSTAYTYDYDCESFDKTAGTYPENMFDIMQKLMAYTPYFDRPEEWTIWTPWPVQKEYRAILKTRNTDLGDMMKTRNGALEYEGINVNWTPNIPTLRCWLTHPDNTIWGIRKMIQLEREREAKAHRTDFILNQHIDAGYRNSWVTVVSKI